MKTLLLLGSALCATLSFGQTQLFNDNFESGTSNWTLNTGTGGNTWVVNNSYTGYAGLIPDTPNQPAGINGAPQSNYLHIVNGQICSLLSACNANFDTGATSNQNAELAASIDATNFTNVQMSFWYICAGQAGTSYGSLEYSIDGGANWTSAGQTYSGTSTWTQETLALPACDNAAAFKIRFKWQNGGAGLDPAFSVDDVVITAIPSTSIDIVSLSPQTTSWCYGEEMSFDINFNATGNYNVGNVYSAELSDASGSFASPTTIGNLTSSSTGSLNITGTVSNTTAIGNGYRIRVVSSDPAIIGSDNGADLSVVELPTVQFDSIPSICINHSPYTLFEGSPSNGTYSGTGVTNGVFNPADAGIGTWVLTYTYTDGNGCSASDMQEITVDGCANINEQEQSKISIYPNPTENQISIVGDVQVLRLELFDSKGSLVKRRNNSSILDVKDLNSGVYFLHIDSDQGKMIERVIIK